jgi:hypothetical protein
MEIVDVEHTRDGSNSGDSPGTRSKLRGLTVSTEYPSESAVAPIKRSAN